MNMRKRWILAAAGMIIAATGSVFARGPSAETDLVAAVAKAETEQKLLFVQYGREACGNCKALKDMIQERQVRLSKSDFVYADLNCDDPTTQQAFRARFKVEGRALPLVVIADPTGKQLASRTGYGNAAEFTEFIRNAKRAYDKDQKVQSIPRNTPARTKPQSSDIAPEDNRAMRSWTASNGAQVTAAVVEQRGDIVVLKKEDGVSVQIRSSSLSKADLDYLDQLRQDESQATEDEP